MGKSDLGETKQMICHLKDNDETSRKMEVLLKLSDSIKRYDHLNGILANFHRFYHDLPVIILKSRARGCQF